MILLSGHSLTHARRVPLEEMSLQLKERDSTATITPVDMDGITVNSWMVDDTEPGRGIVWRVKSIAQAYATRTPTVQLEHTINSLRDNIIFGEVTAATITGNPKATTCTAEQAVRYILSFQHDWVLGSFGYNVSNPYKFDGDSLFDALETVSNSLSGCWWSYDMSVYPFRLNITAKPDGVASEMRAGRNLNVITKTVDKSGMYTRFYPTGKDDLHISGDYVEQNANIYGVVSKVETDNSIDTEEELRRWATERLVNHCEPTVTIDVEGFELADATGEPLDRMQLGRYCRVPLPEFGTTITERIVSLSYTDKINNPEVVKITLGNNRTDLSRIIADSTKSSGKSSRTSTKQDKEDHAWFEDTNDHVAMCAKGIIGVDAQGNPNWTRLSRLEVNENGIYGEVKSVQGEVEIAKTRIDMNEEHITLEATRRAEGDAELSGKLTVQADRITAEVSRASTAEGKLSGRLDVTAEAINAEVTRATTAEGTLSGRITVEADRITQEVTRATTAEGSLSGRITVEAGKITQIVSAVGADGQVTAASICLAINNGGSTATINAGKIYLLGQTIANTITADYIATKIASIANLNVQSISSERGGLSMYSVATTNFSQGGVSCYLPNAIWTLRIQQSGNTYTLQRQRYNDEGWTDVGSFSRATTLTSGWSGGTYTVSASPQGNSHHTALKSVAAADITWDGNVGTFYIYAYNNDSETAVSTGKQMQITAPGVSPTALGIYDTNSAKRTGTVNLGWNGSIDLWAGYTTDGGTTWVWGDQLTVHGKALPTIDNVDRKSSGISGTNAGDVSGKSGTYVTFDMAGSHYYIKIG